MGHSPLLGTCPMQSWAKSNIFKPNHSSYLSEVSNFGLLHVLLAMCKPKGFMSAVKHPDWISTMDEEIHALQNNHTYDLISRLPNKNIMGSKWIFCIKYLCDGTVDYLKACLVTKGYIQQSSLDFMTLSALLWRPIPFGLFSYWPFLIIGIFVNSTSRMSFLMVFCMKKSIWISHPNMLIPNILHMSVSSSSSLWTQASLMCLILLVQLLSLGYGFHL